MSCICKVIGEVLEILGFMGVIFGILIAGGSEWASPDMWFHQFTIGFLLMVGSALVALIGSTIEREAWRCRH